MLPIIAIGASAGGLEAISRLFDALPGTTGCAFIVVQHLDPQHESLMAPLLGEHTAMPVVEAVHGCPLAANHVYVIPPGRFLSVRAGTLRLSAPEAGHGARLPFDWLLRSLAASCGRQSAAVILSGTGGDGSQGLAALHDAGGLILAQSISEAEHPGMPQAALDTALVDAALPLADMPEAILAFAARVTLPGFAAVPATPAGSAEGFAAILAALRHTTGQDFSHYKPGTITRRIARRMALHGMSAGDMLTYAERLRGDSAECALLASELLINVTSFFRDPKVFETLETAILPELLDRLVAGQALRIWVAGCSTGEEAYSIAMACHDALAKARRDIKLQIFASDLDPDAIATAREGLYPHDSAAMIPPERLARYFTQEETGYRVVPALRGHVVFSVQDVLTDPPFSRLHMISCRNLLIYLDSAAQARVIALFHFALRAAGVLMLGTTETIGKPDGRFEPIARADCFYRHVARTRPGEAGFPFSFDGKLPIVTGAAREMPAARRDFGEICERAVLASHAPAAVLINRHNDCLFSMGPTHRFLQIMPGYPTQDLLAMASPALRTRLRHAINRTSAETPFVDGGLARVMIGGAQAHVRITVERLVEAEEELLLVCFAQQQAGSPVVPDNPSPEQASRITELERELAEADAELQASIRDREVAIQEQKAINEEALSINEEFQSTNEELLTSKEELQSLNEELTALNSQLQETLDRQRLASDDLQNVLFSTNVGTMFLDAALRIRFFTPAITPLYNVIAGDIGRPLADLRLIAEDPELLADAQRVLGNEATIEREVRAPGDTWFVRRIFPYRAHDSRIEGVVITFADITDRKHVTSALEEAKLEAERANAAKSRFLAAASHDLRQPLQALALLKDFLAPNVTGERAAELMARFDKTLGALSGMLDVLLNISQIEAGAVQPEPVVFPVGEMLERLHSEFLAVTEARDLSLRFMPSTAWVESDPRLLEQMVRNLLGNAVKYTRTGRILMGCRRRGPTLRIEVWDTGIGIEASQLESIFEEFHQVDNPARESGLGLGLGLSIVRRLGRLLRHPVNVRSEPGRGSVFAITVPLRKGVTHLPPPPPRDPSPETAPKPIARPSAIMVVEDDPDLLELVAQMLRDNGHMVSCAPDAAEALRLIGAGAIRPDILLTDYNLPAGQSGVDLLMALRVRMQRPLPAIVLTGDISHTAKAAIAEADCIHLKKPVNPAALLRAVESLCPPAPNPVVALPPGHTPQVVPVTYVIDDEPHVCEAIRNLLTAHGREVEDFLNAEDFLAAYQKGRPGCLLVDAHLPGLSGIGLLGKLRASGDHLPVILITGDEDIGLAVAAMRAGACDFITKPVGRDALMDSIDRATEQSLGTTIADVAQAEAAICFAALTARQKQVMDMVLAGHPSKNIAADLGISQRTVENHRAEIMHRMAVRSLLELARKVLMVET
ncbi:chemotaxis protein CheB [Novosphingobium sp. PASSN1]|uniref:CheR family methyltransferase n=1 Tax=Novosphingobium sp. PASSN1 TaxID=2015561 RepID=UPI0025CE879E|nr:chemotaxis protein CheB [Novosphingobium sp. PASSN1]